MTNDYKKLIANATTEIFTPGSSLYARYEMKRWLMKLVIPMAIPVIALMTIGFADWRYWIVGAIILFMVYPLCALLGWFGLMAKPWATDAVYPQRIKVTEEQSLEITRYQPAPYDADNKSENHSEKSVGHITIDRDNVTGCELSGNIITVTYRNDKTLRNNAVLLIPRKAFNSDEAFQRFFMALVADNEGFDV